MIITSHILATKRKSNIVEIQDVREAYSLFVDTKRSKEFIEQYEKDFMFNLENGNSELIEVDNIPIDSFDNFNKSMDVN